MKIHVYDDEGEEVKLPMCWEICSQCQGDGNSSAYLGAITQEDWDRDWDYDEREDYFAGKYDRICDSCGGAGKVQVIDEDRLTDEQREQYVSAVQEEISYQQECEMERRMGC